MAIEIDGKRRTDIALAQQYDFEPIGEYGFQVRCRECGKTYRSNQYARTRRHWRYDHGHRLEEELTKLGIA